MASWTELLPSGKYQARYTTPAGKKRSAGTFVHKAAAVKAAAVAEADAHTLGWRDPKAALRTWGEWCEEWWPSRPVSDGTLNRDVFSRDNQLLPRWGDVPLSEITRHDVKAWAAELKRGGMAPATVEKRIYLLSASLNAAVDAQILPGNPAFRLKLPKGETDVRRYLTHDEAAHFMAQFKAPVADAVNEAVVLTLLGTGMRWGEMAGLQVKRVLLERQDIRIAEAWDDKLRKLLPYPKGKKARNIPIPDSLIPYLEALIGKRRTGFVFQRNGFMLDASNWREKFWDGAVERADIGHIRIHDLRHTYASWLLQHPTHPVSLAEVGRLLGHKSTQTTAIYAHLQEQVPLHVRAALPSL